MMPRWSAFFPTPNVAGAELAVIQLMLVTIVGCFQETFKKHKYTIIFPWIPISLLFSILAVSSMAIGATGSRSGLLSVIGMLIVLAATWRGIRRTVCIALVMDAVFFLLMPHGDRLLNLAHDDSVGNRFMLWRASISMIHDHPLTGVGLGNIMSIANEWYLPMGSQGRYTTLQNESMMVAAGWGLPALALMYGIILGIGQMGWTVARCGGRYASTGLALLCGHLVAGQTQAHAFAPWWWMRMTWILSMTLIVIDLWRMHAGRYPFDNTRCPSPLSTRRLSWNCGISALLGCTIYILSTMVATTDWQTEYYDGEILARPRSLPARGLIVAMGSSLANRKRLSDWKQDMWLRGIAIILPTTVPEEAWWNKASAHFSSIHPLIAAATGESAGRLWMLWENNALKSFRTVISDPLDVPPIGSRFDIGQGHGSVVVMLGTTAPFIDSADIMRKMDDDGIPRD